MSTYIRTIFANGGDVTAIPNDAQPGGEVSFTQGFGGNYELEIGVAPDALAVPRNETNYLFNLLSGGIQQYQQYGAPNFITTAENNGVAFPYSTGARVRYSPDGGTTFNYYRSRINNNTSLPTVTANWDLDNDIGGDVFGPSSSTNNTIVTFDGTTGKLIQDSGVTVDSLTGTIEQVQYSSVTASTTTNEIMQFDNSAPTSTEGLLILNDTINPAASSSRIKVDVSIPVLGHSNGITQVRVAVALFRGTTCIDVTTATIEGNTVSRGVSMSVVDSPNTSTNTAYSVRIGSDTATGLLRINGNGIGDLFGNACRATMTLTEIGG